MRVTSSALVLTGISVIALLTAIALYEYNRLDRGYLMEDPLLLDGYGPAITAAAVAVASLVGAMVVARIAHRQRTG